MKYKVLAALLLAALPAAANVMQPLEYHNQLLIPVAGSVQGANGTFFRSDINIVNLRVAEQKIRMRWLPQGRSGIDVAPAEMTLPATSGFFSEDFVTNVLQQSGLGAIQIIAIRADGSLDPEGRLYATSRIWTPVPGGNGTMSQPFPVLPPSTRTTSTRKWVFGVRRDSRYRMNVGVANLSGVKQTFVILTGGAGENPGGETLNVEVEPLSIAQVNVAGSPSGVFQVVFDSVSGTPLWEAWASSIDNTTGDAWSEVASIAPTQ